MALKTNITFELEYTLTCGDLNLPNVETTIKKQVYIEDVYVRVVNVSPITAKAAATLAEGELAEGATVYVEFYDSTKENRLGVKSFEGFMPCNDDDAKNIIKQAYEYLKTLPDFALATNIFEEGQNE